MNFRISNTKLGTLALAAALTLSASAGFAYAQDGAKQDMKSAGHDTKDAAVDTGHGVKTGSEKAYHGTKHVTKKAYHGTKHGVKKAYHKTAKTVDPHANSQDANHQ